MPGTGAVVGVISERDVLRECLHRSTALGAIPVRDAMTRDLIVMDGDRVAGMISIGDLVKASLDEVQYENLT